MTAEPVAAPADRAAPFALFGLRPAYEIDKALLRRRYLALLRRVHPDREPPPGLPRADAVNAAYRALGSDVARANLLCDAAAPGPAGLAAQLAYGERRDAALAAGPAAAERAAAEAAALRDGHLAAFALARGDAAGRELAMANFYEQQREQLRQARLDAL